MSEPRKTPMPSENYAGSKKPYSDARAHNRKRSPEVHGGPGSGSRERTDEGCDFTVKQLSAKKLD